MSLNMPGSESSWIVPLQSLEATKDMSRFDSLLMLKSRVLFAKSTQTLRNLVQLLLRNISAQIEESDIFSDEKLALQMLNIVKDFWSLLSSQHVMITQQAYGRYSALLYEVLPSLASVYIDLFIAVHSTKNSVGKAAKRLYSWLMFELNERCIKTALLEACGCSVAGARLVLPLLRTVLSSPSVTTSNLDYLLHFILLKRWSFICADLCDLIQVSSSIQAPGGFLDWLVQHWPNAVEHMPNDKSLKGRRISEILLELDQQAVQELIDVFSEALSVEQTSEQAMYRVNKRSADETVTDESFFIDKKGREIDKMQLKTGQQFLQKDQRETGIKKYTHISHNHERQTKRDYVKFSEHIDDTHCSKTCEEGTGNNKDGFVDISVEDSADKQKELLKTETMQPLNKKKKLSHIEKHRDNISRLSSDYNTSETQEAVLLGNKDSRDTAFTLAVEAGKEGGKSKCVDHEIHYTRQSAGSNDIATVPESQVRSEVTIHETKSITIHKRAQSKESCTGKENGCSNNVMPSTNKSKTAVKKSNKNPQTRRNHEDLDTDTVDTSTVNIDTQSSLSQLTVLRSNTSAHASFADQIVKKNKQENLKVKSHGPCSFTETESHEKHSREFLDVAQPFENTEVTKVAVKTGSSYTEYKVGRMLSAIRKSTSGDRKRKPDKTDTFRVKTRLRTKSEGMAQADKTRSRNPLITTAADGLKDWLRQTPSSALMNQLSPKKLMPENKEQTKSRIKKAKVKHTTETKELRDIFGTPLKTYSRKDRRKVVTHNTEIKLTPESPVAKHKSPKKESVEESEQRRYFLRTNCSHRLLTTDTVCPSCSPSTKG